MSDRRRRSTGSHGPQRTGANSGYRSFSRSITERFEARGLALTGEANQVKVSTTMKVMKKTLIGTLLATAFASAILAAPVGAAKPKDSITCTAGGLTTVTWVSGTTRAVVTWLRRGRQPGRPGYFHRNDPWARLDGLRHTGQRSHSKRDVLRQKVSAGPARRLHACVTPHTFRSIPKNPHRSFGGIRSSGRGWAKARCLKNPAYRTILAPSWTRPKLKGDGTTPAGWDEATRA